MVLLATVRKYQLCNQLSFMKRTAQTILLSTMQLNKHGTFRKKSTNEDSNSIQSKEEAYSLDKPPEKPEIGACCESGCQNCVWFKYVAEVRFYYGNDKEKWQEALNSIPEPDLRAFVEMQLKKAIKFDT
ncbi:hypothetical protein AVEN_53309-1 [Araneus ventricosus]|uniref:Oxidoreductase-like domain-containing protein n=1 Tax=Araneus ventricosus TaxID=182803 RepID=A0A4Y2ACA5_ARAVE|nr:hypothetical protein AVEN_53309-1 [Araneus ventricosus]